MHLQRPLVRKVNLQPRHSPWLPFRTWFSVNEDGRSTKAPFKWYTYWATTKFVQSHIFDRARSLNYRVYSLPINWFGSTPPLLLVYAVTLLSMFPNRFWAHTFFSAHPSHSYEPLTHLVDQPKRRLTSGLPFTEVVVYSA